MKDGNPITNYFKDSFAELSRVTWPTKNQAVRLTVIVLVFCLVLALLLGVVDYLFSTLFNYIVTNVN